VPGSNVSDVFGRGRQHLFVKMTGTSRLAARRVLCCIAWMCASALIGSRLTCDVSIVQGVTDALAISSPSGSTLATKARRSR
jgi:hypothetical protein